jgi:hypothetical protein
VQLLDACGLETGAKELRYFDSARAGLEGWLLADDAPYVVKDPYLSEDLSRMIADGFDPSCIDAILVPLRKLEEVAHSRMHNFAKTGRLRTAGGLWRSKRPGSQKHVLAESLHQLLLTAAEHQIKVVLLAYPRFVTDPAYAWSCLQPLLPEMDRADFLDKHTATTRRELVTTPPPIGRARASLLDMRWFVKKVNARLRH